MELKKFYLTRGNDIGPDELTHICLFEYHAEKNPLVLVEAYAYEAKCEELAALKRLYEAHKQMHRNPWCGDSPTESIK